MKTMLSIASLAAAFSTISGVHAQAQSGNSIRVTPDNFVRAESDLYFGETVKQGGFGKFQHHREPMDIAKQTVVRANRDTLYSSAVFDLEAGPVTITLPNAEKRFMSLEVISEDHYAQTFYGTQPRTFTRQNSGTRYMLVGIRTLVDPGDPEDLKKAHALQDAIKVSQKECRHLRSSQRCASIVRAPKS